MYSEFPERDIMTIQIQRSREGLTDRDSQSHIVQAGTRRAAELKTSSAIIRAIIATVAVVASLISNNVSASAQKTVTVGPTDSLATQDASHPAAQWDGVQILSDTRGVDFGPYLKQIMPALLKWYVQFLPEKARRPTFASGLTGIRFTINSDGKLAPGQMHLDYSTHDQALDRAAWGAITSQAQFPALPANFTGPDLVIRIEFRVNQPSR
jgi:outer membrane biosynthesis protein TonB